MSSSKLDTSGIFSSFEVGTSETHLSLPIDSVQFHKNGVVFPCGRSIPVWREMTVELCSPKKAGPIQCTGVVVACEGTPKGGYSVSMVFLNLTPGSSKALNALSVA